eukprot:TRINITY_DN3826_c0_g1_i1.p1 TRINITY_DN3826_c0_g1~~TRINITY_DN3826_c0_g1_i1.p1  ORF type:complete len:903 (+),score=199.19 TRINITY_DN3826_c0_g1_i1:37-2745(+)
MEGNQSPESGASSSAQQYSATIVGTELHTGEKGKAYTIFEVLAVLNEDGWIVLRRYSQFYTLNEKLKTRFPAVMKQQARFPRKRLTKNLSPASVEKRHMRLQRYLNDCLAVPQVASSFEMRMFLITGKLPLDQFMHVLSSFAEAVELVDHTQEEKQPEIRTRGRLETIVRGSTQVAGGTLVKADVRYMGTLYKYHDTHWKQRAFQLRGCTLYKYKSAKEEHPCGRYDVHNASVHVLRADEKLHLKGQKDFCFRVIAKGEGRIFAAPSEDQLRQWLLAFKEMLADETPAPQVERKTAMLEEDLDKMVPTETQKLRKMFRQSILNLPIAAASKGQDKDTSRSDPRNIAGPTSGGGSKIQMNKQSISPGPEDGRLASPKPVMAMKSQNALNTRSFIYSLLDQFQNKEDISLGDVLRATSPFFDARTEDASAPLPDALVPQDLALSFVALTTISSREAKLAVLQSLVWCLPRADRKALKALSRFLYRLVNTWQNGRGDLSDSSSGLVEKNDHQTLSPPASASSSTSSFIKKTLAPIDQLAAVFGKNIILPDTIPQLNVAEEGTAFMTEAIHAVTKLLIVNYKGAFSKPPKSGHSNGNRGKNKPVPPSPGSPSSKLSTLTKRPRGGSAKEARTVRKKKKGAATASPDADADAADESKPKNKSMIIVHEGSKVERGNSTVNKPAEKVPIPPITVSSDSDLSSPATSSRSTHYESTLSPRVRNPKSVTSQAELPPKIQWADSSSNNNNSSGGEENISDDDEYDIPDLALEQNPDEAIEAALAAAAAAEAQSEEDLSRKTHRQKKLHTSLAVAARNINMSFRSHLVAELQANNWSNPSNTNTSNNNDSSSSVDNRGSGGTTVSTRFGSRVKPISRASGAEQPQPQQQQHTATTTTTTTTTTHNTQSLDNV